MVKELNKDSNPLATMEDQNFGGFGSAVGIVIQNEMIRNVRAGISSCVQVCYVKRGGVAFTFPEAIMDIGTDNERKISVPPLAKNWIEFKRMLRQKGINLANATAVVA